MKNYQFRPERIELLAEKDMEFVVRDARIVIDTSNGGLKVCHNKNWRLNILAVIGPGEAFDLKFEKVILCEIGIGRTRPYHSANWPRHKRRAGETVSFPKRRKWFALTPEQYQKVAPIIFECLQELVDDAVSLWRSSDPNNPFLVKTSRNAFYQRSGFYLNHSYKPWPRGCRFSISKRDDLLIADIYWNELNSDSIKLHLRGLARFASKMLSDYGKNGYARSFRKLKRVKKLEKIFRAKLNGSLPKYLLPEILHYLPKGKHNPLRDEITYLIQDVARWNGQGTPQRKLAENALPEPKTRIGDIHLRIMSELKKYKTAKNFAVIEIMPSVAVATAVAAAETDCPEFSNGTDSAVPF